MLIKRRSGRKGKDSSMVERFFWTTTNPNDSGSQSHVDGGYNSYHSDTFTLLSGPPSCGKTSLLFQYALNWAAIDSEGYVVFLCNRRRFESKPPFLSQGIDPSSHLFPRIHFKYVEDDEGLKKYFAAFHLLHPFPIAVIVDDFGDFFHERKCQQMLSNARGRDLAMVRVLALCHSAITHANETALCKLLLSDTHHGDTPRFLFLYKRWISSLFTIQGHTTGSFLLKSSILVNDSVLVKKAARFNIALQYLVLEEITEDA